MPPRMSSLIPPLFFEAKLSEIKEPEWETDSLELEALMRNVKGALEKSANLGKAISPEVMVIAANLEDPGRLADLAVSNLDLKVDAAQEILDTIDPVERLRKVHELITKELEVLTMQQQISSQAKGEMDRSHREFFLRQQLKAIQTELGEGTELSEEVRQLRDKARRARMPKDVYAEVNRQIGKLERNAPPILPRPRRCATTSRSWSRFPGAARPRTTWISRR